MRERSGPRRNSGGDGSRDRGKVGMERIIIVGAGLAGSCLALSLLQENERCREQSKKERLDIMIIDRPDSLEGDDAGLVVTPNGTRILYSLGLEADLATTARPLNDIEFYGLKCQLLRRFRNPIDTKRHGCPLICIEKYVLRNILHSHIERLGGKIRYRQQIWSIDHTTTGVTVSFDDGARIHGAYVVGADGADSDVRKFIDTSVPKFPYWTSVHGLSSHELGSMQTVLLNRGIATLYPLANGLTYWSVVQPNSKITPSSSKDTQVSVEELRSQPLPGNISMDDLISTSIYIGKSPLTYASFKRCRARVCLIGDAAHQILPFVSQGAAMAFEDAAVLARTIIKGEGLDSYERQRSKRVEKIVTASYVRGYVMVADNRLVRWVRDWYIWLQRGPELSNWLSDWRLEDCE